MVREMCLEYKFQVSNVMDRLHGIRAGILPYIECLGYRCSPLTFAWESMFPCLY
ncbi:hypothetical protein BDV29DRAFT_166091, partial [Aspergillus leporis]